MQEDPIPYINKKAFAEELGFTKSTFERREKQIGCVFRRGLLSLDDRDLFRQKLKEWEQKRRDDASNKKG